MSRSAPSPKPSDGTGFHVLVVEDHEDTRKMLVALLRSFGPRSRPWGRCGRPSSFAERQPFDLLLSDIGLPDGTGHDVARRVRELQNLRSIALSGFGQDDDLRRSEEAGFEQHLTKPVNLQTLREVVLRAVAKP